MADINLAQTGTLSAEDYAQQQALNRQQKFAELLMTQGTQGQPAGQMVSGRYVPNSFFQNLLPAAQMMAGAYLGKKGDEQATKLAQRIREQQGQALQSWVETNQGSPAQAGGIQGPNGMTTQTTPDMYGADMSLNPQYKQVAPVAAQAPNPQLANLNALKNAYSSPALQQIAISGLKPKEFDLAEGAKRYKEMPDGTIKEVASGGEKLHSVGKNLVTSSGRVVYSAPLTGEEKSNPQEGPLRTTFLGQAQPHIQIASAYRKIEAAPDTAAGDMSKIFGFMKILDPSSTVREGEYASAENARGVPDTIRAQYNKVQSGQRLSPNQRNQFTQAAGDLISSQKDQFEGQKKYFTDVATHLKIDPSNIIYDPYAGMKIQTTPPKAVKLPVNVGQQLNIPSVRSNVINQADAIISGGK
jgi:hypothetical protein